MLRIAVCDDSLYDLKITERMLNEYRNNNPQMELSFELYYHVQELYKEIENGKKYDGYILDIVMPNIGGIQLGEIIREKSENVPIIYTTSSPEFALDAFKVQAIRYLLKPIQSEELRKAMDFLLQVVPEQEVIKYEFNGVDGLEQIPISDIEVVENSSRRMELTKTNGNVIVSKCIRNSFEDSVKSLIELGFFVQTHKSYVINMEYIKKLHPTSVEMDSGTIIPISKNNSAAVKKVYLRYLSSEEH